ncbi:unnamed protein product [Caenorhabditis angaria]|uniref:Uncharacterized protein n=1 Tax=Caenorhabditis angaria TaxID=860376 RepID=A0A9P1IIM8_9PELO|nr:unnamed protein product [Caenorhabditis angaria]
MQPKLWFLWIFCAILWGAVASFDKLTLSKDKNTRLNQKHPISRRVLRFERAISYADYFPQPSEIPIDFAKIRSELPIKTKDSDYMPELDF